MPTRKAASSAPASASERRDPALEHPADGRAHQSGAQQDSDPGLTEELFSKCQNQALHGLVFRRVGGLLQDVKRLEMLPERMRRVCQAAVRERVAGQQIAEFVVHRRHRHVLPGQKRDARRKHKDEHGRTSKQGAGGQTLVETRHASGRLSFRAERLAACSTSVKTKLVKPQMINSRPRIAR